jgi:aldose 1-epimerase
MSGRNTDAPVAPPGWEGEANRLFRLTAHSGAAVAWVINEPGLNCIGYAVRQTDGWIQVLDPGSPQALAERPTRFGCPILFPFPGQVRGARYRWEGVEHTLRPNVPAQPGYGHGFAAHLPWQIEQVAADRIAATFLTTRDLPGGERAAGYPFAVQVRLSLHLGEQGLIITLAATNEGATAAPVGLGLHPYFAIGALGGDRAKVRVDLPGQYEHILADGVPTGERRAVEHAQVQLPPLGEMLHVPRTALGSDLTATLRGQAGGFQVALTFAEGVRDILLFAPPTENSVSVEPLSQPPGAASQPTGHADGLVGLAPGAMQRLAMAINAAR